MSSYNIREMAENLLKDLFEQDKLIRAQQIKINRFEMHKTGPQTFHSPTQSQIDQPRLKK